MKGWELLGRTGFESRLCLALAVWPWANNLVLLAFSLFIDKEDLTCKCQCPFLYYDLYDIFSVSTAMLYSALLFLRFC